MCLYSTEFGVISVCGWPGCVVLYGNMSYMCLSHVEPLWYFHIKAECGFFKTFFSLRAEIMSMNRNSLVVPNQGCKRSSVTSAVASG